jgi:hypothetical protein
VADEAVLKILRKNPIVNAEKLTKSYLVFTGSCSGANHLHVPQPHKITRESL